MPEVIILSSTPPPSIDRRESFSIRRFQSSPPTPAAPRSIALVSDDIDIPEFNYDDVDDFDKSYKRRRLSPETAITKSPLSNGNGKASRDWKSLFAFSDDIALSSDGPSNANPKASVYELESDPIVFTSSAPERIERNPPRGEKETNRREATNANETFLVDDIAVSDGGTGGAPRGKEKRRANWEEMIEEYSDPFRVPDPDELFDFQGESETARPGSESGLGFSSKTASLLASLEERSKSDIGRGGTRTKPKSRRSQDVDEIEGDFDDLPEIRKGHKPKKVTSTKRKTVDKEAKAKERGVPKAQREREKQLEKERKQKLKEEKAKEKQLAADIAQANKLKVDKKDSTPEMIIDLSSSLNETSVGNQTIEYMRRLGVEHSFFDSPIPNVVKWRRKMKARFNDTLGYWEPCDLHIREEGHVLCLVTAQEFVDMTTSSLGTDTANTPSELELHVLRIKRAHPGCTIIYLIEGLTAWMRKNTNSRNKAYQAEFRRHLDEVQGSISTTASSSSSTRPKKTTNTPPVDDDLIEDALLNLQVTHQCLIHQATAAPESAEWIKNFTEHVSTIPYRRQRIEDNDSAFCMESGQVKPGENKSDTFVRMLQEVNRVTASMSYGVINEYPSVVELVRGMRRSGPGMLKDVKKSANKNGALTDSRIGPAASRRLYKVFMGLDPSSTDI